MHTKTTGSAQAVIAQHAHKVNAPTPRQRRLAPQPSSKNKFGAPAPSPDVAPPPVSHQRVSFLRTDPRTNQNPPSSKVALRSRAATSTHEHRALLSEPSSLTTKTLESSNQAPTTSRTDFTTCATCASVISGHIGSEMQRAAIRSATGHDPVTPISR